jgi:hypothetical protein
MAFVNGCQLVQQYETDGNRNVRIKRLESVINTVFHRNYRGGFVKWIQDYEDAFKELALHGQKTWNDDEIKKIHFVQNAQNIGLVYTVFEELVSEGISCFLRLNSGSERSQACFRYKCGTFTIHGIPDFVLLP